MWKATDRAAVIPGPPKAEPGIHERDLEQDRRDRAACSLAVAFMDSGFSLREPKYKRLRLYGK